jgi:GAF domain-containing protein/GTPase SAR1 family protein
MDEKNREELSTIDILRVSTELQSDLIRKLNAESKLEEIMTEIVKKTAKVLKASACTVFLVDKDKENMATQLAGTGYQKQFNGKGDVRVIPANQVSRNPDPNKDEKLGLTGWIISTGKPFLARTPEQVEKHPHHKYRQQIPGEAVKLQSFLGVPLRSLLYGGVVGMIKAERRLPEPEESPVEPFSIMDQLALETIARVASRSIIYFEMAQSNREIEAIHEWARDVIAEAAATEGELDSFLDVVVKVTAAAMRADSCGIFLKDESGNTLTQRAGIGSQALHSVIRAYRLPDPDMLQECLEPHYCNPSECPHRQKQDKEATNYEGKIKFKLTEKSLRKLKEKSIHDNILRDLEPLVDNAFTVEDEFLNAVTQKIGRDQTDIYKESIFSSAEQCVGLTAWIAATGKAFHARNYEELSEHCHHRGGFDPWNFPKGTICGAFLGVPLQVGGTIIGVVKVENISKIGVPDLRDFSESQQQWFEILAQDIALAIMRLQNQIPARYRVIRDAQGTILEILQGGLEVKELAEKVVTETRALFNAGACALFLKEGNRLIQPHWAASGWAQKGPEVREYKLVDEEMIEDNPAPEERVGLTVWIAGKQERFTARSNLEIRMHPHHKGTFDQYNFEKGEQCESFMGFPLSIKEGNESKLVGVLKVETKMKIGERGESQYTYFNELDEIVFELIANSAAIAIQNARLLESRRLAERVLAQSNNNNVLRELYEFLQNREEVMNSLEQTAREVKTDRPDRAEIIQELVGLLEPGFAPVILDQLAKNMASPINSFFSFLARAIRVQSLGEIQVLCKESQQSPEDLPVASLTASQSFLRESVTFLSETLENIGGLLDEYVEDNTKRTLLSLIMGLLQETEKNDSEEKSYKDHLSDTSLFERRILGRVFDRWYRVIKEEHEKFPTIPNPYIVGSPVRSADMFRGREDIFKFAVDNLIAGGQARTLVLYGQRRTGKTSILYQLLAGRLGEGFVPVLIDMQQLALVGSTDEFLERVAYRFAQDARKAGIEVEAPSMQNGVSSSSMVFDRFLDTLEGKLGNRRAVIMFDEFEVIEDRIAKQKLDANILQYLRSLIQHRTRLVFIFTGAHRLEELSKEYWSVFFNIALYKRVSFLQPDEAARLIREPVANALDIDEKAVQEIIRLTNAHPFFVQLICWALVNHCNTHQRNTATVEDVNEVVQEILEAAESHFAYIWEQTQGIERIALVGLAHILDNGKEWGLPNEITRKLNNYGKASYKYTDINDALDRLVKKEVLEISKEGQLGYRFQIEVLRLWVKNKPIHRILEREI